MRRLYLFPSSFSPLKKFITKDIILSATVDHNFQFIIATTIPWFGYSKPVLPLVGSKSG